MRPLRKARDMDSNNEHPSSTLIKESTTLNYQLRVVYVT